VNPKRPRVLVVDHVTKVLGGAEINVVELLAHPIAKEAWDVHIACGPKSRLSEALSPLGWPQHSYGFGASLNELRIVGRRFSSVAKIRGWMEIRQAQQRLAAIVRAIRPDVLLSCTNKDHFTAGAAAKTCGVPSIWWVNDVLSREFFGWAVRRVFVRQARRLATRLAAVSDFGRDALVSQGIPSERVVTIQNGIPLDRYRRDTSRPLRKELGMAPDEPLFGIVGRITPWKGQDRFLELATVWKANDLPGRFAIIGKAFNEEAPYEESLRRLAVERGLEQTIAFVPFQSDVAAALSSLDALIHMSTKPEPFGRVLIEAMAVGTPVLAAKAGGALEIVTPGVNGDLADPASIQDYFDKLRALISSRERRERYSIQGRETVVARFSLTRVFEDFSKLVKEAGRPADGMGAR
jgi:glycosyltransferase involved in cell wall biosynthesis